MIRALLIFLLVIGVIAGGLMLLKRTANDPLPKGTRKRPEDPRDNDDSSGW